MSKRVTPHRGLVLGLVLLWAALAAGAVIVGRQPAGAPASGPGSGEPRYAAVPNAESGDEAAGLAEMAAYWHDRLTYPTGRYDPAWLQAAAAQDRGVARGVPAGRVIYNPAKQASPLTLDPTRFTLLGPAPLNWYIGATSGRINTMVFDPVTPTVAYLGAAGGGVWKTDNCCSPATRWVPVTDGPTISTIGIGDLTIDPHDHNVIYAGTGDLNYTLPEYGSAGILRSTDAGASWTTLGATVFTPPYPQPPGSLPEDQAIGKVRVDPRNAQNLIAGTKTGLFFSYDGGANWSGPCYTNPYTATQRQEVTGLLVRDTGSATELYVAQGTRGFTYTVQSPTMAENGANGIYRAILPAGGCPANWTLLSTPSNGWPAGTGGGIPSYQPGGNTLGRIDMAFAPSTIGPGSPNLTMYAQVQAIRPNVGGQLGVWRTTDGGSTWEQRSTQTGLIPCPGAPSDFPQNWFDQAVAVDPNNPDLVLIDTYDVWKSTDGGQTFNAMTCSYSSGAQSHPDHHAIVFAPGSSTTMLAGTDGGAYSSTDGGAHWDALNDSLSTLEFYSGDISAGFATSGAPAAAGGMQDNGSAIMQWSGTPGPAAWDAIYGGDGFWSRIEPVLEQRWYVEFNGGRLAMSTSGPYGGYFEITGGWRTARRSIITPYELYKYDCPPTGCTHMIVGSTAVSETLTGDNNWVKISPDFSGTINQLSYAVSMSTTALAGTSDGKVQYGFGLGTGNPATWVDVSGGNAVLPNRPILDVTTDSVIPTIGYAAVGGFDPNTPGTPGHVFQVTCAANCASFTWLNKSGNLPDIPINSILANPRFPQQVFAGSDWGLYYTDDITANPPTWQRFQAGLPNVMIWDMSIDRGFTTLSLWTRSRGAFAWPLPDAPVGASPTPTVTGTPPSATPTRTPLTTATATSTPILPSTTTTATPPPPTCPVQFADVPPGSTFYDYIRCLACRGIVGGYPCGGPGEPCPGSYYRPNTNVTRGQVSKIISESAGFADVIPTTQQTFEDVPPIGVFWVWIERLSNRGIISGYPCGGPLEPCSAPDNRPYFRPNNNVTRGQLSKITSGAAGWTETPTGQTFDDAAPGSTFYVYIERIASRGIVNGYPCGGPFEPCITPGNRPYFRPNNNATRGQMAKIAAQAFFPNCQIPIRR
jgi:photosystem II stability/assembly factor-like uncharacterized protein